MPELLERNARPAHVHARRRRRRRLRVPLRLRRHAADLLGRRRPVARLDGRRRAARARRPPDPRHEVDRAGRYRREGARGPRRSAGSSTSATPRTRSSSPRDARSTTSCTRTGSWSARSTAEDADAVAALYATIDAPIVRCDVNSAEMIKLAANAFLMTRISFINEIANVCEATGADVVKVAEGVGLDQRLGPHFLRAGIGYGGSCFPKDSLALKQLASNSGYHFQLLSAVIEVNELQKRRVIGKLKRHLGSLRGQDGRAARARVQGRTPTTCARRRRSCSPRACSPRARRCARWDPVADGDASCRAASRSSARVARRGARRRRGGDRDRVGRAERARAAPRSATRWRTR